MMVAAHAYDTAAAKAVGMRTAYIRRKTEDVGEDFERIGGVNELYVEGREGRGGGLVELASRLGAWGARRGEDWSGASAVEHEGRYSVNKLICDTRQSVHGAASTSSTVLQLSEARPQRPPSRAARPLQLISASLLVALSPQGFRNSSRSTLDYSNLP